MGVKAINAGGRVAIVTGAASGIGRALSVGLCRRGDTVILADLDADRLMAVAKELGALPGAAIPVELDVRDAAAVDRVVDRAFTEYGGLDLLFNNAGIAIGGRLEELTLPHWDRIIDVNLRGVVHGVQAAYPRMLARGRGHIINTASTAGLVPSPLLTPYATTKHAVVGLTLSLRPEAAARGVRVSVVCPGVVETPILDRAMPEDLPQPPSAMNGRAFVTHVAGRPYPAEWFARDVLRGVERNLAVIIAPRPAWLLWMMQRLLPGLVQWYGRRTVAWAQTNLLTGTGAADRRAAAEPGDGDRVAPPSGA
jgi:NAD(P)-dependent dehydrogenase (short-subunit alcohol dehydrogenase family)